MDTGAFTLQADGAVENRQIKQPHFPGTRLLQSITVFRVSAMLGSGLTTRQHQQQATLRARATTLVGKTPETTCGTYEKIWYHRCFFLRLPSDW